MKFFNIIKLTLIYYVASVASYLLICFCAYLNLPYDPLNIYDLLIDFCITLTVVGIVFAVSGALSKNKSIFQFLILYVSNIIVCVLSIAFEGSFVSYVSIAFDSIQIYSYDFFYNNVIHNDYFSHIIALLLSCVYPTFVFLIFNLLAKLIKKQK